MRRLALLIVSLVLALSSVAWVAPAAVVAAQDNGYAPDEEEWAFVDLLNAYRGSLGLGPVTMNSALGAAAEYHSADMAANNYFDHFLYDGTDPGTNIRNFGYSGSNWSENIAAGMASAQEVIIAWQNSPEHNATMTNPSFTEVGVGRFYGEGTYYGWYWTATYGGGETFAPEPAEPAELVAAPEVVPDDGSLLTQTDVNGNVTMSDGTTTIVEEAPSVTTSDGGVVELQQNAVNADGDRAVSTGANPVANGTGETVIYGDINTGGITGESIVYEPPSLTVTGDTPAPAPAAVTAPPPATITTAPNAGPTTVTYTEPNFSETTTTDIQTNDGSNRASG
jgi:uncharacterized protein YkwD